MSALGSKWPEESLWYCFRDSNLTTRYYANCLLLSHNIKLDSEWKCISKDLIDFLYTKKIIRKEWIEKGTIESTQSLYFSTKEIIINQPTEILYETIESIKDISLINIHYIDLLCIISIRKCKWFYLDSIKIKEMLQLGLGVLYFSNEIQNISFNVIRSRYTESLNFFEFKHLFGEFYILFEKIQSIKDLNVLIKII